MSNMHCVLFFIFLMAVETNSILNTTDQDINLTNQYNQTDFNLIYATEMTTTTTTNTKTTATTGTTCPGPIIIKEDNCLFSKKEQREVIMINAIAALLLASFVLLITTLVLSCKVCYLKRQASNRYNFAREMVNAHSWDSQKVEGEATLMMDKCNKLEEDKNEADNKEEEEEEARRVVAGGEAPEPLVHGVSKDEPGENGRSTSEIVFNLEDETAEQSTVEQTVTMGNE